MEILSTQMNLEDIMLNETSQSQEENAAKMPLTRGI